MMPLSTKVPHRVFGTATSGNCHKVRIAMTALGLPYRWHEIDIMKGESRTPEFLRMNANGRVPLLQIDDHTFLPESNAILCYIADGTPLWPGDRLQRARVLQWLFFEQYEHEPNIASARFIRLFLKQPEHPRLPVMTESGYEALGTMDRHLASQAYFAGKVFTIADIALFAYTCVADGGGFDLARYPNVRAWLDRCLTQAGVTVTPNPST